jgi:hypothetical protein
MALLAWIREMKKRTQTGERPRRRTDSQTKKRTQAGGVNGPLNLNPAVRHGYRAARPRSFPCGIRAEGLGFGAFALAGKDLRGCRRAH